MRHSFHSTLGLLRSLLIYYGLPWRISHWAAFYSSFIQPGDLSFDVGAHVGNRTLAMQRCGARVVALEPNRQMYGFLRRWFKKATILPFAIGGKAGEKELHLSWRHPTVSTMSEAWAREVARDPSFASVRWNESYLVGQTTLDALIDQFGMPVFCKIDVEGYELEVLQGLSRPIKTISLEFIPAAIEIALRSLARLDVIGRYEFNVQTGESTRLIFPRWQDVGVIQNFLESLPAGTRSGDIVARLAN